MIIFFYHKREHSIMVEVFVSAFPSQITIIESVENLTLIID